MPEKCFQLMGVFQPITRENRKNGKESERDVDHDEHGRRARSENDFRERGFKIEVMFSGQLILTSSVLGRIIFWSIEETLRLSWPTKVQPLKYRNIFLAEPKVPISLA